MIAKAMWYPNEHTIDKKGKMSRFKYSLLICMLLMQCSDTSIQEEKAKYDTISQHIQVIDEVPLQVKELKNLSVFQGNQEPMYTMELIPEQSFGEPGKPGEPNLRIVEGAFVDKDRLILWDKNECCDFAADYKAYVYNPDGSYHTQIERPSGKSGDFDFIYRVAIKGDNLILYGSLDFFLAIYSAEDYSIRTSITWEEWTERAIKDELGKPFSITDVRNDGNYLVASTSGFIENSRSTIQYVLVDPNGNRLDYGPLKFTSRLSISSHASSPAPSRPIEIVGNSVTTLSDKDELYEAWDQDFLIKKYDADGNYQSAIYYPVKGLPYDINEYAKKAKYKIEDLITEDVPNTRPVISKLKVDDENRIWVAVPKDVEHDHYEWWVLEESGELLAKLVLPEDNPIYDIKNGFLYSKKVDYKTKREFIMKYRIKLNER